MNNLRLIADHPRKSKPKNSRENRPSTTVNIYLYGILYIYIFFFKSYLKSTVIFIHVIPIIHLIIISKQLLKECVLLFRTSTYLLISRKS